MNPFSAATWVRVGRLVRVKTGMLASANFSVAFANP